MTEETQQSVGEKSSREHFAEQMAPISFQELQKFFAKGMLITVADDLDLLDVAVTLHKDDTEQVKKWMDDASIARAHDDDAKEWVAARSMLMAVTVAPWVLVQNIKN